MIYPEWADKELSRELPKLREKGEGQRLEFKVTFPDQAHDIAKEVAAFATSGGGKILIGVNDNGEPIGLKNSSPKDIDQLITRTENIIENVKPRVEADVVLGIENEDTILCIRIEKQKEPVYYYQHRPYIRKGRNSVPAEPDEVRQLIINSCKEEEILTREEKRHQEYMDYIQKSHIERLENSNKTDQKLINRLLGK